MKKNYKKLIWGIVDHCFSSLKPFWPTCHWCIRSWSAFTIYQVPISPYCSDPYSLSDLSQSEGFWLVFTDPSVAWISLSSWGSITHSNGRRQTSGHCSYSLAWSYHKREGERGSKQGGGGWGGALELKLTDRTTDPVILESHEWMLFFPLCWYGLLLSLAMSSQNTEYHSNTGWIYRNCIWMEFDKWVET